MEGTSILPKAIRFVRSAQEVWLKRSRTQLPTSVKRCYNVEDAHFVRRLHHHSVREQVKTKAKFELALHGMVPLLNRPDFSRRSASSLIDGCANLHM